MLNFTAKVRKIFSFYDEWKEVIQFRRNHHMLDRMNMIYVGVKKS